MTDKLSKELFHRLNEIVNRAEEFFGISLEEDLLDDCLPHMAHVFLHELCHAAVENAVPWAAVPEEELDPVEDQAMEMMVIILERSISKEMGLLVHTAEEVAHELGHYAITISPEEIDELQDAWEKRYQPERNIGGLGDCVLKKLREH